MQVAKKENRLEPTLKMNDAKNASLFSLENNATDMIGLSWIVLDSPTLHLAYSERRCNVTG